MDSIKNLNSTYYASEDIFSYAYLNSDTYKSFPYGKNLFNQKFLKNMDAAILFNYDWVVYIPRAPCVSCITELCGTLESQSAIEKCAFIMHKDLSSEDFIFQSMKGIPTENIFFFEGNLGIPLEDEERLFIFTLSKNFIITDIYVPEKKLQNLTEIYLSVTKSKRKGIHNLKSKPKTNYD